MTTAANGEKSRGRAKKRAPAKKRLTRARQQKLVDKAILSIEEKIEANEVKGTVGDLLRLLEFRKEMAVEGQQDITVTWVGDKPSEK